MMRIAGFSFALMMTLLLALSFPAAAQAPAIADMSEAQIKPILVGNWLIQMGYGTGPLTIKDVQDGQLTLSGQLPLVYNKLFLTRGRISGDKIVLVFSLGTAEGIVTSPTHMEGTLSFTGDATNSTTARWRADRLPPAP
jgi:hypothetical protein